MVFAQGADGGNYPIWDGLAKLYLSICIVWTSLLIAGVLFLVLNRNVQCVRVRNLPLSLGAVLSLHIFWMSLMIGYHFNGMVPCAAEYWVMSLYLPFGIALFQASNMQLLSIASAQGRMVSGNMDSFKIAPPSRHALRRWVVQWKETSLVKRTMIIMFIGLGIQFVVSLSLFFGSRKFHSYGTFGEPVDPMECRHGPEWAPSIFMQFAWAWIFAPWVLWKIRNIKDVHHWRLQTTLCVIAGLPSSPLWLAALYSGPTSVFATKINMYWGPPFWFAVSIMSMETVTIFLPCYEVIISARHQRYIAKVLVEWEARRQGGEGKSMHTQNSVQSSKYTTSQASSKASQRSEMYSQGSFERHLIDDSPSLLKFAALREFSGENILFLSFVRDWKQAWRQLNDSPSHRRHFFNVAVEMYADYVDLKSAEFPINIEHDIYVSLQRMFGAAARRLDRPESDNSCNSVTPFSFAGGPPNSRHGDAGSAVELVTSPTTPKVPSTFDEEILPWPLVNTVSEKRNIMGMETRVPSDVEIPAAFGPDTWDRAKDSIKYTVFVNTWPKYVDASLEQSSRVSDEENVGKTQRGRGMCFW